MYSMIMSSAGAHNGSTGLICVAGPGVEDVVPTLSVSTLKDMGGAIRQHTNDREM